MTVIDSLCQGSRTHQELEVLEGRAHGGQMNTVLLISLKKRCNKRTKMVSRKVKGEIRPLGEVLLFL